MFGPPPPPSGPPPQWSVAGQSQVQPPPPTGAPGAPAQSAARPVFRPSQSTLMQPSAPLPGRP
eukprot:1530906-Alexandrium_andersonii.AAC.1